MPFWNASSTTLTNDQMYVNNTYKDANGKNKLSTITATNTTGYVPINANSTDSIVKKTSYAIQNDGKITYQYEDGTGNKRQYNSIQEISNDFGISGYTAATTAKIKSDMQQNLSTKATAALSSNIAPAGPPDESKAAFASIQDLAVPIPGAENTSAPTGFGDLFYPLGAKAKVDDFDFIKFSAYEYGTKNFSDTGVSFSKRSITKSSGSASLPIQPSITDSNGVAWNESSMNAINIAAAGLSVGGIEAIGGGNDAMMKSMLNAIQSTASDKNASAGMAEMLKLYFAGEAGKANGLATKITGAILNPNMELLFQGPQLRPFSYSFRLSPRSDPESAEVKKIIRFFKQNMAVQRGVKDLFLKSPNVFKINYYYKGKENHPGLHAIKDYCALQNCAVDYTPENTYMTFNDSSGKNKDGSMVSYNITLTFMELEPVYADDYDTYNSDKTKIGY